MGRNRVSKRNEKSSGYRLFGFFLGRIIGKKVNETKTGLSINESELLEISLVTIPSNPQANILSIIKNFDENNKILKGIEEIPNKISKVLRPLIERLDALKVSFSYSKSRAIR